MDRSGCPTDNVGKFLLYAMLQGSMLLSLFFIWKILTSGHKHFFNLLLFYNIDRRKLSKEEQLKSAEADHDYRRRKSFTQVKP
jgi:hypothetical protein